MEGEKNTFNQCKEDREDPDCSAQAFRRRRRVYNILGQPICEEPWRDLGQNQNLDEYNLLGQRISKNQHCKESIKSVDGDDCGPMDSWSILGQKLKSDEWSPPDDNLEKRYFNILGQAIKKPSA